MEAWITNAGWQPSHFLVTPGPRGLARRLMAAAAAEATPGLPSGSCRALRRSTLVPVVATATRLGETVAGLASDKEAEMSVVTLQAQDGRRALLAFTGLDALQTWQPDARPVPVTVDRAAHTARTEDLTAILVDLAGPHPLVIEGEVLEELAAGRLVEVAEGSWLGHPFRLRATLGGQGGIDHQSQAFEQGREMPHVANLARGDILTSTDSVVH